MALKLVCVNIEGSRHLDKVVSFLKQESADVVLLQEVFESDLAKLQEATAGNFKFYPMCQKSYAKKGQDNWGIALLSRLPFEDMGENYYGLTDPLVKVPPYDQNTPGEVSKVVGWIKVTK